MMSEGLELAQAIHVVEGRELEVIIRHSFETDFFRGGSPIKWSLENIS